MEQNILNPEGLFNPALRFAFTNILTEPFTSYWGGQPIVVKPGQTVELQHHLACKMTKELVDKIMIGDCKKDEERMQKENPNLILPRSLKGALLGVPSARKEWEDKICRQLKVDEESPEIQIMRAQIREQLLTDISREKSTEPVKVPTSIEEFAELKIDKRTKEYKEMKLKEVHETPDAGTK